MSRFIHHPVRALVASAVLFSGCAKPPVITTASAPTPAMATTAVVNAGSTGARLPDKLSDSDYWKLETDISEPGGYFQIEDNYTSNEMEVGQLYTMLRDNRIAGDVYMGVGPEQNFSYIASIRPKMAFIVDIRRQAVMQHLMFKAMFELAKDRADFISLLFAKPRPAGLDANATIQQLWEAFRTVNTDSVLGVRNYNRVVDRLTRAHGFTFTPDESAKLKAVYDAFYYYGPNIATRGSRAGRGGDFADLTGYSNDATGQPRSFLSSEENYQYLKMLHEKNMIVPVSGDFAGPKAIRAIGAYLKEHNATVRAFYVSNVEQYLFQSKAPAFYANVAMLPLDSTSVFIRPYSMRRSTGMTQSLCPIIPFISAANAGRIMSNEDALDCVR